MLLDRRFATLTATVALAHPACAQPSQLAQTSTRVTAPAPPATPERAVVAPRSAPVPAVSDPDEVIVLVRAGSAGMMKVDGSEESPQLSVRADDGPDRTPTINSQGKHVIFAAPIDGVYKFHVLSLDDMVRTTVTDGRGSDTEPTWAPDGTRFAFMRGGPEDQRHLCRRRAATPAHSR